jgi:UDPglucose 6-dehydrogenase
MNITIIGAGYVGLVTGTCLAELGSTVTCVDISQEKITRLEQGVIPIYEPGLEDLVHKNTHAGRLRFTTSLADAMHNTEIVFIAVGTPQDKDGSADLQYVLGVADDIGRYMQAYTVVITKSTVPVGTSRVVHERIAHQLQMRGVDIPFDIASNPEFLKEGAAINDFMRPDRIVVGVNSARAEEVLQRLYKPFTRRGHALYVMDIASAELTKYAANAMLALRISFMNEIANLCEKVGADIHAVREGIGSDPRIGNKFIYAGIGYGGSCFPKDVLALSNIGTNAGAPQRILSAVNEVNNYQKHRLAEKVYQHFQGDIQGKHFAVWGLAFKPKTDDMREAPSLVVIDDLLKAGSTITAYDPVAMHEARTILGDTITYAESPYEALQKAHALIIVTEWAEFRSPDFAVMETLLTEKTIFDGRNVYDIKEMQNLGWQYYGIGIASATVSYDADND